ncbi:LysR family transcriptional regulator [Streptomyces sp. NPDC058001]|uniref:LysR family transcriptional regulator n=1 Tax=Streptomyces sp. NPDC058001 TaxID=3346300 RepID=UPI0036E3BB9F
MPIPHDAPGSAPGSRDLSTPLLRVFVEVARLGSFTAAGPVLGYTQSAISRQISALEDEAGTVLFDRLPRGVRLTEPGRRLLGHAEAVLDRLDTARRDLADLRELATGRLRVGAFATADAALVPRAVSAFRRGYPEVTVTLREGFTPELLALLAAGDADVAVVSYPGPHHIDGFDLRKLCDDYMYVALPADHRLAGARQLRLADLADEEWIAGSSRPEDTLISSCLRTGFQPRIGFVARDWMAKQGFVAAGVGITLVPSLAADAVRPDIALALLHPDDIPPRQVYAATASGFTPSPATREFLALLGRRPHGPGGRRPQS